MIRNRHSWIVKAHTEMLRTGLELTPSQARQMFGTPEGTSSVNTRLANAKKGGWFSATPIPGAKEYRYKALPKVQTPNLHPPKVKADRPTQPKAPFDGLGRGFPRVSSIFDLGPLL